MLASQIPFAERWGLSVYGADVLHADIEAILPFGISDRCAANDMTERVKSQRMAFSRYG